MSAARVVYFSVDEYAGDTISVNTFGGESIELDDPHDGPRYEVEITVTAGSRKDALEAAATKILSEIAAYG